MTSVGNKNSAWTKIYSCVAWMESAARSLVLIIITQVLVYLVQMNVSQHKDPAEWEDEYSCRDEWKLIAIRVRHTWDRASVLLF